MLLGEIIKMIALLCMDNFGQHYTCCSISEDIGDNIIHNMIGRKLSDPNKADQNKS